MTVIARDAVASDHLVYAWPLPIGPECEVACADDEQVIMCPAWMVGDRLGPGRHRYRTPDPTRPVAAFFVLTAPVEAPFDMTTSFVIPTTGQPVRLRATGSLHVRCADASLLIAQFVGLPFDHVNDGILRSVARSVERMLARLLTRRVIMASTPLAVTDPAMLPNIIEELVAYNPTAGAVFGVELMRMGHLTIASDDGSSPYVQLPVANGHRAHAKTDAPPLRAASEPSPRGSDPDLDRHVKPESTPPSPMPPPIPASSNPSIEPPKRMPTNPGASEPPKTASGEIVPRSKEPPKVRAASAIEVPRSPDEITQPGVRTPVPGSVRLTTPVPGTMRLSTSDIEPMDTDQDEPRGAILGIGVGAIGHVASGTVSGEIPQTVAPGGRVLVPGPNGLMQSATVRQLLQGYYELEVGSSGETIWVPISGVVPES